MTNTSNNANSVNNSSVAIKRDLQELIPTYEPTQEVFEEEDYMNEAKRAHFKTLLNNLKKQLMEEVDRTVAQMKDDVSNFPDPIDRASQEEDFNMELRARDRERKLMHKIDEALGRLEASKYGYCEACEEQIGYKRLEARPIATLCIDCKTVDEVRERRGG